MKYCPEIGKIYDTLFYCLEYYNQKTVKEYLLKMYADNSLMAVCYNEIEANIPPLPPILAPIFYHQNKKHSAISSFFIEQVDFENETIDSFIKKIISKSDLFYSKILDVIFPSDQTNRPVVPLIAPESYIEALTDSDFSESFKLQVSLLFGNFNYAISILTDQLRTVYSKVDELYQKYHDKISTVASQIESEKNSQIYKEVLGFDASSNDYSISLLNQYITLIIKNTSNSNTGVLFGLRHEDDLNLQFDERNIDLRQIMIAIGNDTRYSILQVLMEKEELTASSIAKILDLPPTTALRHVEYLYDSNVLYISRRSGLQIFYRINYNILSSANKLIASKLGGKTNENTSKEESIGKVG